PDQTSIPNLAFLLTDASVENPAQRKVVWMTYVTHDRVGLPPQLWSAEVAWHSERKEASVVVVKSMSWHVTVQVFFVDPAKELATFPLQLDPKNYRAWPRAPQPSAQLQRRLAGKEVNGIARIRLLAEPQHLFLFGERDSPKAPPVYWRLSLKTKDWF